MFPSDGKGEEMSSMISDGGPDAAATAARSVGGEWSLSCLEPHALLLLEKGLLSCLEPQALLHDVWLHMQKQWWRPGQRSYHLSFYYL